MKLYKLNTHTRGCNKSYDADLVLNPQDHPTAKVGDVVEIYSPEDENGTHLLLQITELNEQSKTGRNVISIESCIATAFKMRSYSNVVMQIVNPADVALDSIEITFKDQYMGRSEMWRLKTYLTNTCVYVNKKIDYNDMQIRCQVYEMWSQGERVASGVITDDTKIVFRSSTSMVYLFLQMSSEMWDFDIHGDLYFEKAVNGFLTELFQKWKKLGCNHEVTIVLFSRTFYAAKSLDEFPAHMRDCLQLDYKGRYYEDFYRVAIQNERNDDWCTVLAQLRKLFTSYQETVLRYHERQHMHIPHATNSTATQGNFLEVLNISLNTFEKHYLDRTFDRTGQLSVVITPGVGVFSVDRELTNITKQRIIDNGVGSDLVCVGEQPLHAVPLLKFHNKDTTLTSADDYSLPHWINLSFYSTNKKIAYSSFIPRIKLPILSAVDETDVEESERNFLSCNQSEYIHNSLFDYDAYDEQIFQPLPAQSTCSLQRVVRAKKTSVPSFETYAYRNNDWENLTPTKIPSLRRKMSDPDIHHGTSGMLAALTDATNLSESLASEKNARRTIVSIAPIVRPGRALINPFDPSHVTIKLTSNRRRWTHIFPKGPTGVLIQQHHYQAVPAKATPAANYSRQLQHSTSSNNNCNANNNNENDYNNAAAGEQYDQVSTHSLMSLSKSIASQQFVMGEEKVDFFKRRHNSLLTATAAAANVPNLTATQAKSYLWGATGEQEWTPAITTENGNATGKHMKPIVEVDHSNFGSSPLEATTPEAVGKGKIIIGVDWKSLSIPACLPITTDYFPDKRSLHNDYVISDYTLLPDDVNLDYARSRAVYRKPLSTEEVCKEIVSQRLAQGFQLIVVEEKPSASNGCCSTSGPGCALTSNQCSTVLPPSAETRKEYLLSIGRIFHKISLTGSVITVTGYRPRHPYPPINVDYRYRFHAPQHETYEISGVNFTTEKLENFNWNHMDLYICTRGDVDYPLMDSLKYWRFRMYLLPRENMVNKIVSFGSQRCDIFTDAVVDNTREQIDDFVRLIENVSKLKRQIGRKARDSPTTHSLTKRRHSTSIISRPPNQHDTPTPRITEKNHNLLNAPQQSINVRSKLEASRISRIFPGTDAAAAAAASNAAAGVIPRDDQDDGFPVDIKFSANITLAEIFEAMKHPITGVGYFTQTQSLPSCTFVSYDALLWLKARLSNGRHPLDILEAMRKEHMICHASGDWSKPIIAGFVFYYVVQQDKNAKDYAPPLNDYSAFVNEWLEIEFQGCSFLWHDEPSPSEVPNFLRDTTAPQSWKTKRVYRQSHLEIDVNQKSDRMEWGHVKHHTVMQPGFAFELVVEWVTSSGPIVSDLISGWMRKAIHCSYQLVSVPADPMAEPFTKKSDPLRGPIFIPLCVTFLPDGAALFDEFPEESRADRMLFLQEAILARFGFLPCVLEETNKDLPKEYQYVHCTGNMFALIRCASNKNQVESPSRQEANVTRCVYGHTNNTNVPKKVGFLWAWNHMIPNKKWKALTINNSENGELFQLKMLKDFREFCSNSDQRLANFWANCQELKRKSKKFEYNNNNNDDSKNI
ncbi:GATOR complex protein Iml1 isoform X2 [Drosophila sulfurigaster albostrigata]|uniref:GATOR complex protein Iml1 isoform X2 n=1 Tax=Drosophila sulfurigaster albostrigata TaxID=89887 RepID=UPI002D2189B0|nr:GATOR complex protein Iml1 isoform X2 [Drosophila sulfurigaster albostrigata]